MKWLLVIFFGEVILLGESFKVSDINVAGVILALICAHLTLLQVPRLHVRIMRYHLWLAVIVAVFWTMGVLKYPAADVIEDLVPFAVFLVVGVSLTYLRRADRLLICRLVVVFSAIALLKVLAISFLDIQPAWGGNTVWQGAKHEMPSGIHRVILKGGDVFIGVSTILVLGQFLLKRGLEWLFRPFVSLLLLAGLSVALLFSFTRASVVAIWLGILLWLVTVPGPGIVDLRRTVVVFGVLSLIVAGSCAVGALWYRTLAMRFAGGEDLALDYRLFEAVNALEVAKEASFLGGGLGAHYYTVWSGSTKEDGRSLYVHSLPVWLLLKVGVLGGVLFYGMLGSEVIRRRRAAGAALALRRLKTAGLLAGGLPALFFLAVNDVVDNKFATLSGAAAYALVLAIHEHWAPAITGTGEGAAEGRLMDGMIRRRAG